MNERIRELAEQATDTVENVNPDTGITHHREFFDKEKFAELIVRECAEWVNDNVGLIDQKALADLLKHFGLKDGN
jgi:tRNA A37 threonylcarbamoyladenosine dehydratase